MKKGRSFRSGLFALLLAVLVLGTSCSGGSKGTVELESVADLNAPGYKIGLSQGAASMYHAEKAFPDAELLYFMSNVDGYEAVRTGKIDAYVYDRDIMTFAVAKIDGLELIDEPIDYVDIVVGVGRDEAVLLEQVNAFIARIKADGTFEDMHNRWITYAEDDMPEIPVPSNPKGTLTVGTTGTVEPMSYFDASHELTGFDVELMRRLAAELEMELKIVELDFTPLLASLETGKIDLAISNLNYSEETTGNVVFSDAYMVSATELLVKKGRFVTSSNRPIGGLEDLKGRKVGILAATVMEEVLAGKVPEARTVSYRSYPDQIEALQEGRISAMVLDSPVGRYLASKNEGLLLLPEKIQVDRYAFVMARDSRLPAGEIDAVIRGFREDGTLDDLAAKWISGSAEEKKLPVIGLQGGNGILRFGTYSEIEPFSYKGEDGSIVGYDLELAMRIAEKLGMRLEVVDMEFEEMIPQVRAGAVDLFGSCVTVTEERSALVRFTEPYYEGGISVLVVDPEYKEQGQGFWEGLKRSVFNTFVSEGRYELILKGLGVTVLISVASGVLGSVLGFGVCFMRRARSRWLSVPAGFLIRGVQEVPIVLFLMLLYYVVFASLEIDAVLVAIIGFSINFSVYVAEMLRSGIESVDKGQIEAASAMGFGKVRTFVRVVLPQASWFFMPVYKGEFVNMVKMTSVVGYIAIQDLTKMSDIIRSRTYEAFFPLIATAVLYFLITYVFMLFLSFVEKRGDPKSRRRVVRGVTGGGGEVE